MAVDPFADLAPPRRAVDPFADLGPPEPAADPFADLEPVAPATGVIGDYIDPSGMGALNDPVSMLKGAAASFVDLSKGVVQSLAGGLTSVLAAPSAVIGGQPELIPQAFHDVSSAFPMEPVWEQILSPQTNLAREQIGAPIAELGTLPTAGEELGNIVLEKTGSPVAAAFAATALQAAPLAAGTKLGSELLKGGKAAGKAIVEDIPQETLYKKGKKTTYRREDLQRILTQDPAADPVLLERVTTDPAFRESIAKKIRKGDISVEELHPNWLGKILGKEPITSETVVPPETPPAVEPKGALPAEGETGATPAPPGPDLMPGGQGGAAGPLPGTVLESKAIPDAANAVATRDMWIRQGFDATIEGDPTGLGHIVTRKVKGYPETVQDPFADLAPASTPEAIAPALVEEASMLSTVETPTTAPSPGRAAGPEPSITKAKMVPSRGPDGKVKWTAVPVEEITEEPFVERRAAPAEGPRQRRTDEAQRARVQEMIEQGDVEGVHAAIYTDPLTGAKNRRAWDEADKTDARFGTLDLEGMKAVNDDPALGHAVGDILLKNAVEALKEAGLDPYRTGGDEFSILFDQDTESTALNKLGEAKRIFSEKPILFPTKDGPGVILKGAKFNFGVGTSEKEADYYANEAKRISVEAGLRARRGELPQWAKEGNEEAGGDEAGKPASGEIQKGEVADEKPQADAIVPDAIRKGAPGAETRNAPVDAGDEPVEGKTAETGKSGEEKEVTAIAPRGAGAVTPVPPAIAKTEEEERITSTNGQGISDPEKRDKLLEKIGLKVGEVIEFKWNVEQKDWGTTTVVGVSNTKNGPVPITRPKMRHALAPNDVLWDPSTWRKIEKKVTGSRTRPAPAVTPVPAEIAKKPPEEVTHPAPTPPYSDRWTSDRGAIPGEPSHFLDGETAEDAKGILIERVSEQGTSSWDGYLPGGLPVVDGQTFENAAKKMEERVDRDTIEAGKGGENAPVLEGTVRGEPGDVPAGSPGATAEAGETGSVPGQPRGSGDRDGEEVKKGRPGRGSGRGTRDRLPVPEGEGGSGGPVEEAVLEDVAPAVAAANEEFGLTPGKTDYVLTPEDVDFKGRGAKTRTRDNIAAIKLAMQLSEENRLATPEEQKTLVRYSGWGGLSDAFHGAGYKQEWMEIRRELYDLLDTETYSAARDSILNAHYTSIQVVDAMWAAVKSAGFAGGRVLEPGAGIGNFLMRAPMDVKGKTRFTAVELDLMSGSILKQLNQSQDVRIQGYQESSLSDNFYDLAISNVPFVETPILSDPRFTRQRFVLHDYYFAKTLDKVRPGGLIAFITSRYTMDKKDAKIRKYIAGKADLLGAIRLPRTAFKANAATEVVTDIIFLKRRADGEAPAGKAWKGLKLFGTEKGSADLNEYYFEHPENVLGRHSFEGSMYGPGQYTVDSAEEYGDLEEAVRERASRFTAGTYEPRKIAYGAKKKPPRSEIQLEGISAIPESSFLIKDGKVYQRQADKLVEVASSPAAVKKYRTFIDLGAAARALVTNQLDPEYTDEKFNKDRGALNRLYDAATKNNVRLGHKTNQQFFGEDPNWNLIRALEHFDSDTKTVRKADILTKRVVQPNRKVESAASPRDALLITLRETGEINLPRIAELLGTSEAKAWDAIRGDAFQTPDGLLEIRDQYLSGNVRKKLREAEAAAAIDPRFGPNVEALQAVIPEDVPPGDIYVNFGAPWIAPEYIDEFIKEVLEDAYTRTTFFPGTGTWGIERGRGYRSSSNVALLQTTYGTNRIDAIDIILLALNQQSPKIYDTVYDDAGNERRVINTPETLAAKQRLADLKTKFQSWLWEDKERTRILHRAYNDNFNSFVEPKHDGTKIYDVDGRVLVPDQNTNITLRATQINAVWRALTEGNTLLWHEVGTGKTFIMAALAKELRRTGAAQKPMIVVPKVIFGQIQQNLMTLFPGARVLAPSADDFKPANRKRFLYRIATGDWDAIVLTKEHFQRIPPPAGIEDELIHEALDELERAIVAEQGGNTGKRSPTLRQLIKLRDRLREQLQNLANVKRDEETLTFDQLGVDYVMVDESHYFKNLRYTTRMNGVAGMGNPAGNKRSWDLFVKTTYLNRMTKNRGVLLSTGTPISNSIAELYTIQRYLSPDLLKELDIAAFDSWAATFASVETGYEITVDGGYKAKDRFSDFNNMPELSRMVRQVADTVTAQMAGVKRPTADRITIECPASQEYLDYQDEITKRADAIRQRQVDPKTDNFPKLSTDGRHAAVDIRLRVPNAPDHPDSKVNKLVANVFDEYKKGKEGRLTQLVFLDLGVETVKAKKKKTAEEGPADGEAAPESIAAIRTYTDIKQKLLKLGVPAGELALIQDKKYDSEEGRLALYDAVNEGKVRILIGSTSKMSEGMNVQKRLVALHHMDPTWTPMGIMQREGRILRQGNTNERVRIYTYLTTGRGGKASFDAFMWQLMESKAGPISELQTNATPARTMGDVSGIVLNAAEWKALSTGNPLVVEKVKLQDEFNRLNALEAHHRSAQFNIPLQIERIMGEVRQDERRKALVEKDLAMLKSHPDADVVTIGGKTFDVRGGEGQKDRMETFSAALVKIYEKMKKTEPATTYEQEQAGFRKIGEYRGYEIVSVYTKFYDHGVDKEAVSVKMELEASGTSGFYRMYATLEPAGGDGLRIRNMLDRTMNQITPEAIDRIQGEIDKQKAGAEALRKEIGKPFKDAKRLKEVSDRLRAVDMELGITQERAEDAVSAAVAQDEVLLDEEAGEKPEGPGDGTTLYASPLDPALIAQAWRSLKKSTEELKERHRLAKSATGLDLHWFNKAVNTPYFIFTEKFPRYRGVFDRMRQMMQERDDIAASLAEDAVSFFSGLEFAEKEAVNKLLIKGRYQRKVYTREELERDGRLSTKQMDAYFGIRAMLDRALDIYEDGIMYRVTKGKMKASSNLSIPLIKDALAGLNYPDDKIELIVKLLTQMRETKRKGYAPFARFGRFAYGYVHVGEDGRPDWQNPSNYFAKEETAWKAAEKYQALLKRFAKGIEEGRLIPVPPKELKESEEAKLIQEIGGFELEAIRKIMDLDPEIAASLRETVEQFFQAQGFKRHFFESKDSPGFSTDMERALADYIVSLSGFVARIKGIPEMDNAAAGMERIPELARYYREWKNYSISPQEEFHRLRAGLFLYFLGGNVKSAAINLTQTFVTTIPWLTQYVSPFRAAEEVTRAVKDMTAAMGKREDGTFGVVVDKLPKDVREIVRRGYDEGIISEQLIYDLMGTARKPSSIRKLSKQKQRAVRGFGYLFSLAEKTNRLISLIAAARIHIALSQKHQAKVTQFTAAGGRGGGQEPPKPPGGGVMPFEDDPFEFGKRATDETQFIYAKYNRPKMFRGWGSLLGTFRTFVINFLEFLARLWNRKSIKAVGSVFVMLWAFSGILGMPFAENVKYILEEITGMVTHKKPDLETAVREWGYDNMGGPEFMDYLIHGPFRHATGFDISASVGVGDVLPFFDKNFARSPLETVIGAPAEVIFKRPARAYGLLKEGQTYRAVEAVAPEFLRNPMYAARVLKEGVLDRAGGQIVAKKDISPADTAKKALGFMPTQIAKSYEREEAKARIGERSEQLKKDATRNLLNALRIGDRQKALAILKSVGPKPGVPPEDWITIDEKAIEKQYENAMLPPELRGLLKQPVLQRPAWLKMNKVYGGK